MDLQYYNLKHKRREIEVSFYINNDKSNVFIQFDAHHIHHKLCDFNKPKKISYPILSLEVITKIFSSCHTTSEKHE